MGRLFSIKDRNFTFKSSNINIFNVKVPILVKSGDFYKNYGEPELFSNQILPNYKIGLIGPFTGYEIIRKYKRSFSHEFGINTKLHFATNNLSEIYPLTTEFLYSNDIIGSLNNSVVYNESTFYPVQIEPINSNTRYKISSLLKIKYLNETLDYIEYIVDELWFKRDSDLDRFFTVDKNYILTKIYDSIIDGRLMLNDRNDQIFDIISNVLGDSYVDCIYGWLYDRIHDFSESNRSDLNLLLKIIKQLLKSNLVHYKDQGDIISLKFFINNKFTSKYLSFLLKLSSEYLCSGKTKNFGAFQSYINISDLFSGEFKLKCSNGVANFTKNNFSHDNNQYLNIHIDYYH